MSARGEEVFSKSYDWVGFSQSYLFLAKLGCQELLDERSNKHKRHKEDHVFSAPYFTNDLFVPILFNLKHGVEIFTKTLKFILSEKLKKEDLSHNISDLFTTLEDEIEKHHIKKVIQEERKINPQRTELQIAEQDVEHLPRFLERIKKLVDKYYHCEVLRKNLGNDFIIEDVDNTAFRYPQNNLKVKIDYGKVLERITTEDINEILKDVDNLIENFNSLGFLLDVYSAHK